MPLELSPELLQLASCLYVGGSTLCAPILNKFTEKFAEKMGEKPIELLVDAIFDKLGQAVPKFTGRQLVTVQTLPAALEATDDLNSLNTLLGKELPQLLSAMLQQDRQALLTELKAAIGDQSRLIEANQVFIGPPGRRITLDPKLPNPEGNDQWARFHYTSNWLNFVGREAEQTQIAAFLAHNPDKSLAVWWVLGDGGQGKSRLAAHCCRTAELDGWKTGFLPLTETLPADWQPDAPTLLVIDYPARFDPLISWLSTWHSQTRYWRFPVRVLLLERAKNIIRTDGLENSEVVAWSAMQYQPDQPLMLGPLSQPDIVALMRQVLKHRGVPLNQFSDATLWAKVQEIDPDLQRPLLAAYIADALADGEHPETRDELLDRLLQKERNRWLIWLDGDKALLLQYQQLVYLATLMGSCPQTVFDDPALAALLPGDAFRLDVYTQMVGHATDGDTLLPLEPDILGEWYLLNPPFTGDRGGKKALATLQRAAWQRNFGIITYVLYRTTRDFCYRANTVLNWIVTARTYGVPDQQIALALLGQAIGTPEATRREAIEKLENLDITHDGVLVSYAQALFYLTVAMPEATRREAIEKLENMDITHDGVLVSYAQALFNLAVDTPEATKRESIEKLETLDITNEGVFVAYIMALCNLAAGTPEATKREAIEKLETLDITHEGVLVEYSKALFSLTTCEPEATKREAIEKLETLDITHEGVLVEYAKALCNLTACEPEATKREAIEKLETLDITHEGVLLEYAKALFNLTLCESEAMKQEAIKKLDGLLPNATVWMPVLIQKLMPHGHAFLAHLDSLSCIAPQARCMAVLKQAMLNALPDTAVEVACS